MYENINYFVNRRNEKRVSGLYIGTSYILAKDESNYRDLMQYINYWGERADRIMINPERHYYEPDLNEAGYEFKIDCHADFSCTMIHGKLIGPDHIASVCCEAKPEEENTLGDMLDPASLEMIHKKHRLLLEQGLSQNKAAL